MPALKQEYDYYEYASRRRQGTVKNAAPSSTVHKKVSATSTSSNKRTTTSGVRQVNVEKSNLKTTTTREITRNATRIATRDDNFIGTKKTSRSNNTSKAKQTDKKASIDPVVFNNKKSLKKPQEMTLTKPKSSVKSKSVAKQKARVEEMFKNFVMASLVFGMLFLICYRYSSINEAFNEVNDIKSNLRDKQTINAQIESNIKQNTDLAYIENYAKYQLGMQKPKDTQIQKINVEKQDKIILPIEIEEKEEKGFFEELVDKVLNAVN